MLNLSQFAALESIVQDRDLSDGLSGWLKLQEQRYTEMCRNQQNVVPESLGAQAKKEALVAQYAAMAKAYGTVFAELKTAVEGREQ